MKVIHSLDPIYDKFSKILILGSMPSIKSRELGFYYMNPRNRFWKTLSIVFQEKIGTTKEEKIDFLYRHNIALFDVIKCCDIEASNDSSIKKVIPNDFSEIIENSKIEVIFCVGRKAFELYNKYCYTNTKIEAIYLPSTSPANCVKGIDDILVKEYSQIKNYVE